MLRIQAPAHELDTLNTVIKKCMRVSASLGQRYTVITVDQALYCKLVELKLAVPGHMCFLATIRNHMKGSVLSESWVESGGS